MPQLIAMVIVVVGAMIYMFQTFGGTGDKIEGVAQKASIITEITNIKNGLELASRDRLIINGNGTITTLADLANADYFAEQMNNEIGDNAVAGNLAGQANSYSPISFGGEERADMLINLITNAVVDGAGNITNRPGIRVTLAGRLTANAGFLETQLATDLGAIASIDRTTTDAAAVALDNDGNTPAATRPVGDGDGTVAVDAAALTDGIFTVYFKDMTANVQQPQP